MVKNPLYFIFRNVFITVDGKKAKLLIQESSKLSFTMPSTCDCNVIVYAVSDRNSFGKLLKVLMINIFHFPASLDIAVSLLSRMFKNGRESGRDKRVILVGNKADLARNREVSSKVILKKHQLSFYFVPLYSRREGILQFFTDQNSLKLELELGIILINF